MLRAYKFRIYPDEKRQSEIDERLVLAMGRFIQMLSYKAGSAGLRVIKVDPTNTTKLCSGCGNIQDMPLSERTYICSACGLHIDRDINAAVNILNRATAGPAGSHARGNNARPQNEAAVEEPRTYPAIAGEAPTFR